MPIIEMKNLTKYYPRPGKSREKFTAVDHISLDIQEGEIFGILGPNGAGKTTTLEMTEGLKEISEGSVIVAGISVKENPMEVKQVIGVQLQKSEYFDYLNLAELLNVFGSFYNRKIDADKLLRQAQLTEKKRARAKDLSGGQKQRLSIASALVNDPKVLFLDEPTTGLDPQARHNLWELIETIHQTGKTIVLTTHYMEEAQRLCDRVAIMDQAKIIALGTPLELIATYTKTSKIKFNADKEIAADKLQTLPSVAQVAANHRTHELYVTNAEDTLHSLIEFSKQQGFHLTSLQVSQATLEDVFLNLTGRKLRE